MRRRNSVSSASEKFTRNGRTASLAVAPTNRRSRSTASRLSVAFIAFSSGLWFLLRRLPASDTCVLGPVSCGLSDAAYVLVVQAADWGRVDPTRASCAPGFSGRFAERSEARAELLGKELRLLPGGVVPSPFDLVEVNELRIRPLGPATWGLIILAGKRAHGRRDGDVGGVVEAEVKLPIEASRGDRRVRQPVERDVVEDVVPRQVARRMPVDRASEHGRGHRRRRLAIAVAMVEHPGRQADGRIRQSIPPF